MRAMGTALVALGLFAAVACAQDIAWRPVTPATTRGQAPEGEADGDTGVLLGQPQSLATAPAGGVQQASFVVVGATGVFEPGPALPPQNTPGAGTMLPPLEVQPPTLPPAGDQGRSFAVLKEGTVAAPIAQQQEPKEKPKNDTLPSVQGIPNGAHHPGVPYALDCWERADPVPPCYVPDDYGGLGADVLNHHLPRFYASAEYLLWWTRGDRVPALVTTGPDNGGFNPGNLAAPGTVILIGNGVLDPAPHSGVRATVGIWCDDDHCLGFEVSGFALPQRKRILGVTSDQFPLLARPFFEVNPGPFFGEATEIAARPGLSTGTVTVSTSNELWGIEPSIRHQICCSAPCCEGWGYRVEALAGFRYLQLTDSLSILEDLQVAKTTPPVSPALPNGGQAFVFDQFRTRNEFYGGQAGISGEVRKGPWTVGLEGKLALGATHQVVDINGSSLQIDAVTGAQQRAAGGLLALPTNIGHYTRDRFAVVPQLGLKLGYNFTEHVRLTVGYDLLYWNNVVRPGGQIDRGIDVTHIPFFATTAAEQPTGLRRPGPLLNSTDFWAQGFNVGLEITY
jgi:hypothetical protein